MTYCRGGDTANQLIGITAFLKHGFSPGRVIEHGVPRSGEVVTLQEKDSVSKENRFEDLLWLAKSVNTRTAYFVQIHSTRHKHLPV